MIRAISSVLVMVTVTLVAPAYGAAYLKLGDIKGESTEASQPAPNKRLKANDAPPSAGLLVPAVQKAREAANSNDGKKGGNVEFEWKVEEGEK